MHLRTYLSPFFFLRAGFTLVCVGALSACGGGGGDPSGGGGNGSTGLVPPAQALGTVLYAKGTDIRPVRVGAKWVYHRNDFAEGFDSDVTTVATAGAAGQVLETDSSDPTEPATVTANADGSVSVSQQVTVGKGFLTISGFELRSPVQANDQYVLYDGSVSDIDVDGDGKSDVVELALWRQVIGNEVISLPNRATPTTAARVDTFVSLKVTPSSGGATQTVTNHSSTWYERGVGQVRQTTASTSSTRPLDDEDVLTGWDGVTEGRGYITQPLQSVAPGAPGTVGAAYASVRLADGALVLASTGIHKLDKNGVVQSTSSAPVSIGRLFDTSAGVRGLSGVWPTEQIYSLSDSGAYIGQTGSFDFSHGRPFTIQDVPTTPACYPGARVIWLAWQRTYSQTQYSAPVDEIVLRGIGPDGSTVVPEMTFPVTALLSPGTIHLAPQPHGTVLTWTEYNTSSVTTVRAVRVTDAGQVAYDGSPVVLPALFPSSATPIAPYTDGTTVWLTWTVNVAGTPGQSTPTVYGVRLDDAGNAVAPVGGSSLLAGINADILPTWPAGITADGGHLFATGSGSGTLFANDHLPASWTTYVDYDAGTGPLASSLSQLALFRIPGVQTSNSNSAVVFSDRVLLLTEQGNYYLRPTVIWR